MAIMIKYDQANGRYYASFSNAKKQSSIGSGLTLYSAIEDLERSVSLSGRASTVGMSVLHSKHFHPERAGFRSRFGVYIPISIASLLIVSTLVINLLAGSRS